MEEVKPPQEIRPNGFQDVSPPSFYISNPQINLSTYQSPSKTEYLFMQQRTTSKMSDDQTPLLLQHNTTIINNNNNKNEEEEQEPESLSEKLRTHYHKGSPRGSKAKIFARVAFQFQVFTFCFMSLFYLAPWVTEEYDTFATLCLDIGIMYIFIMIQTNWLFSIITESDLPENIPDLPPESSELDETSLQNLNINIQNILIQPPDTSSSFSSSLSPSLSTSPPNNVTTLPRIDSYGMIWKYCQMCNKFRPPRTYHCKFCRKCILRRDHHCHLVGKCIGHYNQRYFVVLCFYTTLASAIGFPITCSYLSDHQEASSWTWYILPYTFLLFLFRYVSWRFTMLAINCYLMFIFGICALFYSLAQLSMISMGKTLVEVIKQMDMKVTSSLSENFALVFGDNWFLNFVLPLPTVFKQKHNGIRYNKVKIFGKKKEDDM